MMKYNGKRTIQHEPSHYWYCANVQVPNRADIQKTKMLHEMIRINRSVEFLYSFEHFEVGNDESNCLNYLKYVWLLIRRFLTPLLLLLLL